MAMWPSLSVANWLSTFGWCEVKPNRKKDLFFFCWQLFIFNCCLATAGARCLKRRSREEESFRFSLISGGLLISEERRKKAGQGRGIASPCCQSRGLTTKLNGLCLFGKWKEKTSPIPRHGLVLETVAPFYV